MRGLIPFASPCRATVGRPPPFIHHLDSVRALWPLALSQRAARDDTGCARPAGEVTVREEAQQGAAWAQFVESATGPIRLPTVRRAPKSCILSSRRQPGSVPVCPKPRRAVTIADTPVDLGDSPDIIGDCWRSSAASKRSDCR